MFFPEKSLDKCPPPSGNELHDRRLSPSPCIYMFTICHPLRAVASGPVVLAQVLCSPRAESTCLEAGGGGAAGDLDPVRAAVASLSSVFLLASFLPHFLPYCAPSTVQLAVPWSPENVTVATKAPRVPDHILTTFPGQNPSSP